MTHTKQTVYLPVKVEDELPKDNVLCISESGGIAAGKLEVNSRGVIACDTDAIGCTVNHITHYLKSSEAFVFTPEELNQLLSDIIKDTLSTAAEKSKIDYKEDGEITKVKSKKLDIDYLSEVSATVSFKLNKQSITDTFDITYQKHKV